MYIVCKDCGKKFLFSATVQKYFDLKGWDDPKRCRDCKNYRNTRYLMCSSF
ncbi:MAG: zinc-ribbon domain containing protein [Firmicutes bacterium]|nr:zinc-ribbon domain containing protein [Bacillota bacterium]